MAIIKESGNKKPSVPLREDWVKSSKQELFAAIEKYKNLKFSLFLVGPDHNIIESGKRINAPNGMYLFMDTNGVVSGFMSSYVSSRVDQMDETNWNFNIGRAEYKLYINLR